jgi:hypothetical protein
VRDADSKLRRAKVPKPIEQTPIAAEQNDSTMLGRRRVAKNTTIGEPRIPGHDKHEPITPGALY